MFGRKNWLKFRIVKIGLGQASVIVFPSMMELGV